MAGQTVEKIGDDEFKVEEEELNLDGIESEDGVTGGSEEKTDDSPNVEPKDDDLNDDDNSSETDEVVVSIGEETPPQDDEVSKAPEWVRELRKTARDQKKKIRELEAKLQTPGTDVKSVELGKKPTLEDCDYDSDKYENELDKWYEKKRERDQHESETKTEQDRQKQDWQNTLDSYGEKKSKLKVKDFDDAEAAVQDAFSTTQQGMIVQGADNAALVFYALGKNTKRLAELASIKDPVKFAFAVAKLETQLKVTNRKAATQPEKTVSGNARSSGSVDSTLERLRTEAEKTGEYTKIRQYKKQKRATK